jgi:hypothetical protein
MTIRWHFSFEPDWRFAPLAFWVHLPLEGRPGECWPPAPPALPRRGYAWLRVEHRGHELVFSAPAQLDHCIAVLATRPLPTSRRLAAARGEAVGPNGHWLSRLPAVLKAPKPRAALVSDLLALRETLFGHRDLNVPPPVAWPSVRFLHPNPHR